MFIHSSADASTIREMFIEEQPPADDSGEEVKTEHAHVPEKEDSRSSDLTEFDLQPSDFSFDDTPSEDIGENSDDDLNENDVGMFKFKLFRQETLTRHKQCLEKVIGHAANCTTFIATERFGKSSIKLYSFFYYYYFEYLAFEVYL